MVGCAAVTDADADPRPQQRACATAAAHALLTLGNSAQSSRWKALWRWGRASSSHAMPGASASQPATSDVRPGSCRTSSGVLGEG